MTLEREDSNALKDRQNVGEHHRRPFPTSPGGIIIPTGTPPRDLHARKNPPSPGAQHPPTDKFGALAFAADVREGHETVPGFRGPTGTGFTTVTRTDTGIVEPTWHFPTITPPEN